jgi:hypothetical protein
MRKVLIFMQESALKMAGSSTSMDTCHLVIGDFSRNGLWLTGAS